MMDFIDSYLTETVDSFAAVRGGAHQRQAMQDMADGIVGAFRAGKKLMICGNGGSAADAQHIAGEFISRLMFDRAPLPAIALTTDTSVLTATGNDYGYEKVFERQVLGLGQEGDVLLGISTSGTSANVVRAFAAARSKGVLCYGFTGEKGAAMGALCEIVLVAPTSQTAVIQQIHIVAAHIVCALVEQMMFSKPEP